MNLMMVHVFHPDMQFYSLKTYIHGSCIICQLYCINTCHTIASVSQILIHLPTPSSPCSVSCPLDTITDLHFSSYLYPKLMMAVLRKHKKNKSLQPNKIATGEFVTVLLHVFTIWESTMTVLRHLRHLLAACDKMRIVPHSRALRPGAHKSGISA